MNFLLTGGTGFIGSNLAELLLADKHSVTILDDLSSGYRENLHSDATFILGDISRPGVVHDAAKGADAILHLAASVGNTRSIEDTPQRPPAERRTGQPRLHPGRQRHTRLYALGRPERRSRQIFALVA
ncbi:MAG: NAD-dependent epimerase/dehydratase family protein [Actinobacteria bacterium]|nr:NAD-dependent epimerase/dehydratase family protein [Actinomycetota bacterium]